jgi:pimeloyl-ACP methyl ester carboxylesterase
MTTASNRPKVARRAIVKSAVGLIATGALAAGGAARPARAQARKATFVLVHGAWHGGWCWQRMTPMLRAAGHDVHAPTLTGLGERAHLAGPRTSLNTHIVDVVSMLQMEDLKDIVLVGHSYAGFVITGAANRSPSRVKTLVYVNAFVPEDGKSLLDYVPPDRRAAYEKPGKDRGYFESFPLSHYAVTKPEDVAWVQPRITTQPYLTFAQPLKLRAGMPKAPKAYVRCGDPVYAPMEGVANRFRNDPGWKYAEVSGGHDAMITNPRGLADALLSLA